MKSEDDSTEAIVAPFAKIHTFTLHLSPFTFHSSLPFHLSLFTLSTILFPYRLENSHGNIGIVVEAFEGVGATAYGEYRHNVARMACGGESET